MFGAGYMEMLARQMTAELQGVRDSLQLGESKPLVAKGVSLGSIAAPTPVERPTLILRRRHQASNLVSLREFTNTAFNQHRTTDAAGKRCRPQSKDSPRRRARSCPPPDSLAGYRESRATALVD